MWPDAKAVITNSAPEWTDLSAGDPGVALMEAFAYLADATIYRLNQVPDKLFVEFLRLIGVRLQPPSAAIAMLRFTRGPKAPPGLIEIPRGTRVTLGAASGGTEPPVFATLELARLDAGAATVDVRAIHAELVEGELLGVANGQAGLSFTVKRPPIIAKSGDPLDLLVGVEATSSEIGETRDRHRVRRAPATSCGMRSTTSASSARTIRPSSPTARRASSCSLPPLAS